MIVYHKIVNRVWSSCDDCLVQYSRENNYSVSTCVTLSLILQCKSINKPLSFLKQSGEYAGLIVLKLHTEITPLALFAHFAFSVCESITQSASKKLKKFYNQFSWSHKLSWTNILYLMPIAFLNNYGLSYSSGFRSQFPGATTACLSPQPRYCGLCCGNIWQEWKSLCLETYIGRPSKSTPRSNTVDFTFQPEPKPQGQIIKRRVGWWAAIHGSASSPNFVRKWSAGQHIGPDAIFVDYASK